MTPLPTSMVLGVVTLGAVSRPASWSLRYIRSLKFTWLRLKPVVFMLARLLAVVSMIICWAFMPVAAVENARNMVSPC